jgi:dimethylhistidine N-methyltransferase
MNPVTFPTADATLQTPAFEPVAAVSEAPVARAVRAGLSTRPRRLPPWLFYDQAGSLLFERITALPEYYLTRTERGILTAHASEIVARAAQGKRLRIVELGAGSADKTRLLLAAAVAAQGSVLYEPVDVSATALDAARQRIEREIPGVTVAPRVMDYVHGFDLDSGVAPDGPPEDFDARRLVLYIGSSIGNFDPEEATRLLARVRAALRPGDGLLLGVDRVKEKSILLAAYDDAAGVTAEFNLNLLARLNRELGANFNLRAFRHKAVWDAVHSRMEMYLESLSAQKVHIRALDLDLEFVPGERIHTENSYKYAPGQAERMLENAAFAPAVSWTDSKGWFGVCLGRVEARAQGRGSTV